MDYRFESWLPDGVGEEIIYLGQFAALSDKDLTDIAELERIYALQDERD